MNFQRHLEKKKPKYEPKETKIEQLGNTRVYLDIDCRKDIRIVLNKRAQSMTLFYDIRNKLG